MASGFFALFDDIATLLDDVAILTKVAAKKTAGVLGDDLALNAQQVAGVNADRELPVVWAVAKGSMWNKVILVPLALLISVFVPALITPLLMLGGAYLCIEGVEKLWHTWRHRKDHDAQHHAELVQELVKSEADLMAFEKDKIKGAIRTDFVLSAEIIVITLGAVAGQSLTQQILVLSTVAVIMTIGVYGAVAGIVKLDDLGLWLQSRGSAIQKTMGSGLLALAPWLMKTLSVVGTAAMFLVGGSILAHGWPALGHWLATWPAGLSFVGEGLVGLIAGALLLPIWSLVHGWIEKYQANKSKA